MESIKRIGRVCQQHYEKIALTVALVGLACAVAVLSVAGQADEDGGGGRVAEAKVEPVDMSRNEDVLKTLANPPALDFTTPHNLINPVKWQKKQDGTLLKIATGQEVGVSQLKVSKITPLHYSIEIYRVASDTSAYLRIMDESATSLLGRRPKSKFITKDDTKRNEIFQMKEWNGGKADLSLSMELVSNEKVVTVTKEMPYREVRAYSTELKYDIDGRSFPNLREGAEIRFGGEAYKIVAIHRDEVVLSAVLNKRKHTIKYSGG